MMHGVVNPFKEAILPLRLLGPSGQALDITAVVDTGFTDYLTLSKDEIVSLDLVDAGTMKVTLADGSETDLGVFIADIEWDGATIPITVLEADGGPLVGMSLLYGFALYIEVIDGGSVQINRLATQSP